MTRPRRWAAAVAWWLRPGLANDPVPAPRHLRRPVTTPAAVCTCARYRADGSLWWFCPVHRGQTTDPRGIT